MAEEELAEAIELEDETEEVPDNFVDQMASRIGIILQREMDPTVGATEVTKYIYETTYPNKVNYFLDAMEMLHESHTTDKYAALTWSGMISAAAHNKDYDTFMHAMLDKMIQGYYGMEKPDAELKDRKFSAFTTIMAKTFIKMIDSIPNLPIPLRKSIPMWCVRRWNLMRRRRRMKTKVASPCRTWRSFMTMSSII